MRKRGNILIGASKEKPEVSLGSSGNLLILVSDLKKSVEFYQGTLGLKMTGGVPGDFAFFQWGGITLALHAFDGPIASCRCEISFSVPNVKEVYAALSKKGVAFTRPLRAITGNATHEMLASDFRDPDGHVLSITGWVPKKT